MSLHRIGRGLFAAGLALACCSSIAFAQTAQPMRRITHGLPPLVAQSRALGVVPADETISLSLFLPLRNQTVRIPALATAATLSFWLHIDTRETTTTLKNDTLTVQLMDLTDATKSETLATYSNLDHNVGYASISFPLSAATYAGHTLQLLLTGSENSSLRTSFVVDDFALAITE